jgi:hypothetical protein
LRSILSAIGRGVVAALTFPMRVIYEFEITLWGYEREMLREGRRERERRRKRDQSVAGRR